MRTRIIKIGNSQGIRIPQRLLRRANLSGMGELEAVPGQLVVRAARKPREGWERAFRLLAARGDDALLDPLDPSPTEWDGEW